MAELRWILLAAGVVLILGLWIWERRRPRAEVEPGPFAVSAERVEPVLDGDPVDLDEDDLPAVSVSPADRIGVATELPVVEIPADVRPELAKAVRTEIPVIERVPRPVPIEATEGPVRLQTSTAAPNPQPRTGERDDWVRTQPLRRAERLPEQRDTESVNSPAAADPGVARQRIVALRIMSAGERWPGSQLLETLHAEGLVFGKYSIFHCQRDDGRAIFSVASMVEPGSFDLDGIDSESFPGVSLFAVLPGPLDAPSTFDQMLACARRMSDRLGGNLQDEHGSSLTGQRVLNLREELVHFEHLLARLRARKG